jgi:WD40 repeat protein
MKRHQLFYGIIFLLLSVSFITSTAQDTPSNLIGFVATDSAINVRNRPSSNGAVIGSLPANMSVTILEQSADGAWLSVELPDGSSGWVSAALVRVMQSAIPADLVPITPDNADQLIQITQLVPHFSTELVFSPDSRLLATHFWENRIEIYDVRTKILVTSLDDQSDLIARVRFSPDGSEFASASWDGTVKIWNTQTWGLHTTLNGHADGVNAIAYNSDGTLLASGGNNGLVIIWNLQTGERLHEIDAHRQRVNQLAFSPDGTMLASSGSYTDSNLRLWDVATGERIWQQNSIGHFVFSPAGDTLIALRSSSFSIIGIAIETLSQTFAIAGTGTTGTNLDVNPDGTLVVVGRWRTGAFHVADITSESILFTDDSQRRSRQVTINVAFSPDGRLIATASDEAVFLWGVHGD